VASALIGAFAGVLGLYISWHSDLAAGGTIVLTATALFVLALVLSPRHGLVARYWRRAGVARSA